MSSLLSNKLLFLRRLPLNRPELYKRQFGTQNLLHSIMTSSMMKLFTDKGNPVSLKIVASSYVAELPLDVKFVSKQGFTHPGCFPTQLPILEVSAGKYLFNPNASSQFIFNQSKLSTPKELNKKIDELLEWESAKLQPIILPALKELVCNKKPLDLSSHKAVINVLSMLNGIVGNNSYLLGSSITVADVVICGCLYGVMQDQNIRAASSKQESLLKWFDHVSTLAPFLKAVQTITHSEGVDAFKESLDTYSLPPLGQNKSKTTYVKPEHTHDIPVMTEESEGPTAEEIENAKVYWLKGFEGIPKPRKYVHPILPKAGEKNILITSALPYVNNVPHLGNVIGCILSSDVYARFCRLRNYNSIYICGTDEYGTATETKAIAEGLTPKEICDKYHKIHSDIYKWFNIDFDYFGRTTTEQQKKITQDIFWKVWNNGFLLEDTVDQLQCIQCNKFLADRFVEGICPFCSYEDARGDQCDSCGKLINAVELKKPRCKQCGSSPELKTSQHIFIDLPKIEPQLRDWLQNSEEANWTHNAKHITKGWLADGLKPRCITRDLKWGIPVPLEGYTDKVFYVWFDAPIGYISITANYTSEWEKWWKNPEEVTLVQFMAKDNVPFHTVLFPSSLLAANDNYTILNEISATEYLNYEDDKFSKSRGVGVFGDHAASTGIPADIFRFYLLYVRPESQDSAFQWSEFFTRNNSELLNNLGNFVNRALMFLKNNFDSLVPELSLIEEDFKLIASVNKDLTAYIEHLDKIKLRDGLRLILNMSRAGNQYIQSNKPWVLVKGNEKERARAGTVIGLSINVSALISVLLKPYMPVVSEELQMQLALPAECVIVPDHFIPMLSVGHTIGVPSPLFQKLDPQFAEQLKKQFMGTKAPLKKTAEQKPNAVVDTARMEALEIEISKQGDIVRKAKSEKANKDIINAEVLKLLDLKKALASAQGIDPNVKPKKQIVKQNKKTTSNTSNKPVVDSAKVESLEIEVSKQGDIVRKAKSEKASKDIIDAEVKILLDLKRLLAVAQGLDPNAKPSKQNKAKKDKI